jgi:hypothetical protein
MLGFDLQRFIAEIVGNIAWPRDDLLRSPLMTTQAKPSLSVFALSAAALFLGACTKSGETTTPDTGSVAVDDQVKCFGINECAGQSVCGVNKPELGIEHACAGENECAGKGWIKVARSECEAKDGEVLGKL